MATVDSYIKNSLYGSGSLETPSTVRASAVQSNITNALNTPNLPQSVKDNFTTAQSAMKAGNYTAAQTALKAALGGTPIPAATVAMAATTLRTAAVNNAV